MTEPKIGGNSNPYGFIISFDPLYKFGIKSKNYNKGLALLRGIQLSGVVIGTILMFFLPWPFNFVVFFILAFVTMTFSERIAMKIPQFRDNFQEWHAAEQKLINLLLTDQELTIENLRKSSMTCSRCGEGNSFLKEPSEEKLQEALEVGQIYLERKNSN